MQGHRLAIFANIGSVLTKRVSDGLQNLFRSFAFDVFFPMQNNNHIEVSMALECSASRNRSRRKGIQNSELVLQERHYPVLSATCGLPMVSGKADILNKLIEGYGDGVWHGM